MSHESEQYLATLDGIEADAPISYGEIVITAATRIEASEQAHDWGEDLASKVGRRATLSLTKNGENCYSHVFRTP